MYHVERAEIRHTGGQTGQTLLASSDTGCYHIIHTVQPGEQTSIEHLHYQRETERETAQPLQTNGEANICFNPPPAGVRSTDETTSQL